MAGQFQSHVDLLNEMIAHQCPDSQWEPEGKALFSFRMCCDGTMYVIAKKVNGVREAPYKYKILAYEFVSGNDKRTIGLREAARHER